MEKLCKYIQGSAGLPLDGGVRRICVAVSEAGTVTGYMPLPSR